MSLFTFELICLWVANIDTMLNELKDGNFMMVVDGLE